MALRQSTTRGIRRNQLARDSGFERFYRDHVGEVYQYALGVLANPADAEDVTQQTFLNAYRAFQKGERPHTPHNWLIKIAHNVCRMRWRQSGRRPQEVPLENAPEPAGPDNEKPALDQVLQALAQLPLNQRAAIVMREVEGRSYAEIAEVLGTSVPAVEALLFRARSNLRERRDALGILTLAPLPGSLSSFLGGGGAGLVAAGGAAVGTEIALKAAAVVATGVVAGGLGFKAVEAVAKPDAPASQQAAQARAAAAPVGANGAHQTAGVAQAKRSQGGSLLHRGRAGGHGASVADPRKAPTNDRPSAANAPSSGNGASGGSASAPTGAAAAATPASASAASGPAAASSSSTPSAGLSPGTTVNKIVGAVPLPAVPALPVPVPPPPTLPATTISVPTVTVPTVTVPTVTVPTLTTPTLTTPTLPLPPPPPVVK